MDDCSARVNLVGTRSLSDSSGAWVSVAMQMHQQQRNGRGRDAADPTRLTQRGGTHALQLRRNFRRQAAHAVIIETRGNRRGFVAALALDFVVLADRKSVV